MSRNYSLAIILMSLAAQLFLSDLLAQDWPMRGHSSSRASFVANKDGPRSWDPKKVFNKAKPVGEKNAQDARIGVVKWVEGDFWDAMCDPVVANGLLWIGTANPMGKKTEDASVLACFDTKTGALLYQHVSQKLGVARQDWPGTGNTSTPFIEGNRLWFCTNRLEVICMNIWIDNSPGADIVRNQHCNPVIFQKNGQNYVAIGQGDGFVRAFESQTGKLKWQFDLNTLAERRAKNAYAKRRLLTESPVFDGERLYFVIGADREGGFERGGIYCIGPFGSGDVNPEIIVENSSQKNKNSKLIWEHSELEGMQVHISTAGLCVTPSFLFSADIDGMVKCFDKRSGKLHWKHDMQAAVIGTPLVVGDTLYVADEDGDVEVLKASAEYEFISGMNHAQPIESSPIYADETLFIVTRYKVFAIGE